MALTTALRDLPPHLRLLAWPALNRRGALTGVTVSTPSGLAAGPASLACYSRETSIAIRPRYEGADPESLLTAPEHTDLLAEPLRLVGTLALWDSVVRVSGVYAGDIYLASERSVARLLHIAHAGEPPTSVDLGELLEQLHALELLYRFPVAQKFRAAHGQERQCRINGWGQLLFRLLSGTHTDPFGLVAARGRLSQHLRDHRSSYLRGVRAASAAKDHGSTRLWDDIHAEQPIPVLV
ncbi:hypothetical protein [Streptomyces albipurpureus]|uniref:Uncharacterized protein n=1 Tax=Streptomyces albipurpureus TaxID=2897419 RepID=A0ABT0UWS0_9ACTN|nr:hypothetical protein [Streptomyces sp. CWNU-1]MCM2392540.1 hypothetical protein [Streptomyces sp. CWNU-1]